VAANLSTQISSSTSMYMAAVSTAVASESSRANAACSDTLNSKVITVTNLVGSSSNDYMTWFAYV
jgi:hypothetical protein